MKQLDFSKPLRTVGVHEPVRLLCTDRKHKGEDRQRPCLGLILMPDGSEALVDFDWFGNTFSVKGFIENVPERVKRWVNVYRDSCGDLITGRRAYESEAKAREFAMSGCLTLLATVPIEFEE